MDIIEKHVKIYQMMKMSVKHTPKPETRLKQLYIYQKESLKGMLD